MSRIMPNLADDVKAVVQKQKEVERMNEHLKMREYISYLMDENKKLKKRVKKLEKEIRKIKYRKD